ncbi:hypothetical protein [Spirulina sp.]|uniref:hypothetical protein n=1 Tax=Spirulina sp. TaxID=1157 RepID=UPI003F6FCC40
MSEDQQTGSNLSREDALRQLQGLIAQLETVVGRLETTESDETLRSLPLADLTRSVEQVITVFQPHPPDSDHSPEAAIAPDSELTEPEPAPPTASPEAEPEDWGGFDNDTDANPPTEPLPEPKGLDAVLPTFRQLQRTWDRLLKSVRSFLPDTLNETLSDWMLTGIISSVVVVVLIGSVVLTGDNSAPTAIAPTAPSSPTAPTLSPRPTPTPSPTPKPAPPSTPKPQPAPATPPLRLTPEQRLIAAIQDQVAEITNQYAEGLIRSIQADFLGSRLVVTVGEAWYGLEARRQDQVANEVLVRSRRLDFSQVELRDENGDQVARNPIVGSEMVILQRSPSQEAIALP